MCTGKTYRREIWALCSGFRMAQLAIDGKLPSAKDVKVIEEEARRR